MSPDAPLTTIFTSRFWQPVGARRLSKVARDDRRRAALRASATACAPALPLAPSPILFGLSYGVLADATGFGSAAAVVMSATTFAGAAQFASVSVLDAGGTRRCRDPRGGLPQRALHRDQRDGGVDLSGRQAPSTRRVAGDRRRVVGAVGSARELRVADPRRVGARLLRASGSRARAAGTLVGGVLGDPNALGLDAAFAALFLALAVPYLRERRAREAAALAAGIVLVLTRSRPPACRSSRPPRRASSGSGDERRRGSSSRSSARRRSPSRRQGRFWSGRRAASAAAPGRSSSCSRR